MSNKLTLQEVVARYGELRLWFASYVPDNFTFIGHAIDYPPHDHSSVILRLERRVVNGVKKHQAFLLKEWADNFLALYVVDADGETIFGEVRA